MPYLGTVELKASDIRRIDITSSTSATHTLTWTAPNEQSLIVTINGVKQQNNYTVSGTTLTLDTALGASDLLEVIGINDIGTTITPAQGSVDTDQMANDAITSAKIADGAVANADLADMAANTIKVRDANSSGVPSDKALATTEILIGDGTGFTAASLSSDVTMTNAGAVTIANDAVTTAKILDNNVTLAKLDDGTQGDILYYGASGAPARLGFGTDGHFLKTQGTGANPVWAADTGGLFSSYAIVSDQKPQGTVQQSITSGDWRVLDVNTEIADPDGIVSISSNRISLAAGSYLIKAVVSGYKGNAQSARIYDYTNTAVVGFGFSTYLDAVHNFYQDLHMMTRVTPSGTTEYEFQRQVGATSTPGSTSNYQVETYLYAEIYKET